MRVPELMEAGINVSLGHDDVMDPWYPMGSHDMLDAAHMGAHALHMTGTKQQEALFDAVTVNGAKTLNLEGFGLKKGCHADMVILQASSKLEAVRWQRIQTASCDSPGGINGSVAGCFEPCRADRQVLPDLQRLLAN